MRTTGVAALALLLLAGCGGTGQADEAEPPKASASETVAATLAETCPEIEAALPSGMAPPSYRWAAYSDRLAELRAAGDAETQNAVDVLTPAVDALAVNPSGLDLLDARDQLRSALGSLARRCAAVGSSALQ